MKKFGVISLNVCVALVCLQSLSFAQDLNTGLVAYWPFCDCSAKDHTGNGHDGTLVRGPTCVAGIYDSAFQFHGSDWIAVPFSSAFDIPTDSALTLAAWVKPSSIGGYQALVVKGSDAWDYGLYIDISGSFMFGCSWPNHETFSTTRPQAGQWYHVVGVYRKSSWKIFVNGVLEDQVAKGTPIGRSMNPLGMAIKGNYQKDMYSGILDEVRFYDRALSDSEVMALYLWRGPGTFALSTSSEKINGHGCVPFDTAVHFWAEGCGPSAVSLDSVWISGATAFRGKNLGRVPRLVFADDSVGLEYLSNTYLPDTSLLHLRFHSGNLFGDTAVSLFGSGGGGPSALSINEKMFMWARCSGLDTIVPFGIEGCLPSTAMLDSAWIEGSSAFQLYDVRKSPRYLGARDSIGVRYAPSNHLLDTSWLHMRFDLGAGTRDTSIELMGTNRGTPATLSVNPEEFMWSICTELDTAVPLSIIGCLTALTKLDTAWIGGSAAFQISDFRSTPRVLRPKDSIQLHYAPDPNGADTSWLHLRYDLGAGAIDTIIGLFGASASTPPTLLLPTERTFLRTACSGSLDSTLPLGILGCLPKQSKLDSIWIDGSQTFRINDVRKLPRVLSPNDSIPLRYAPRGRSIDTGLLHIRYDFGGVMHDTTLSLLGTSSSPFIGSNAYQHLAIRSGALGESVTMPLQEDLSAQAYLMASWSNLKSLTALISFDSTKLTYLSYVAPLGWTASSVVPHGNSLQFSITNVSSSPTNPLDMGSALFTVHGRHAGMTLVALNDLWLKIGDSSDEVCLGTTEDELWGVEIIQQSSSVSSTALSSPIQVHPNPFEDRISIDDPDRIITSVEIVDVLGRSTTSEVLWKDREAVVETANLPAGLYIVVCHMHDKTHSIRMMKAH
ncbi:MAG: LamG-like jellyroll fold domain-containing protein [Bacteroidota bacterium]|nr:LamG-like jellyroll fold domain-containing protein [Bacteroidota bacterium]MDP4244105.1 LamG-like jellyroll fold domain-containing protein [Bacteroidota bacterium]MDP4289394.1 LamG-like jellyroll fold domain-containing protein [Bacteroidota bacterium]